MLHVHRSRRAEDLVTALAGLLAAPAPGADPFAPELLAVGAPGTERWIAQRLSHHLGAADPGAGDGICARVDFRGTGALLDEVVAGLGPRHADAAARWDADALPWHLLQVLDEVAAEPAGTDDALAVLRHHLRPGTDDAGPGGAAGGAPRAGRVGVATRLAALLARCGTSRPALLARWATDAGAGADLPADLRWWPEVYRRVRERVGAPAPAELLDEACAQLRAGTPLPGVPARLGVFAVAPLATAHLALLAALAEHREVHLWLPHPSPRLWDALAPHARAAGGGDGAGTSRERWEAQAGALVRHPLLRSCSREVRELQVRLAALAPGHTDTLHAGARHPDQPTGGPTTLLGHLQRALAEDDPTAPASPPDPVGPPADRSVQVHACHGRTRQVEVLREAVLGLMDTDPTLQPRDVLVVCSDVEAYAPVLSAVFATDGHPGAALRVSVADRSPLQANPLLALAARLLELAAGRATATDVLDLAAAEPVRLRFGFDEEELEQLRRWAVEAGVHWGLGPEHRRAWRLGEVRQGSWRTGLDRVLAGVALGGDLLPSAGHQDPVVPLADVESSRVDLAGRFAELLERLEAAAGRLTGRQPVAQWCDALLEGVLDLGAAPADSAWWEAQVRRELGGVRERAARAGGAPVELADAAALLSQRLGGGAARVPFRTGAMTVCPPGPLRAVPHRVVCLLGMDDGAFPRAGAPDGDDPLERDPHVGDRDPRGEDRQAFLDAVLAAGEHLLVLCSGRDVRTGAALPPAVPVGELLDALDALGPAGGPRVRERVLVHHPLQPTDARNFTAGALGREGAFSFDATARAGALAAAAGTRPPGPFLDRALPAPPADGPAELDLDALVRFWQHPARGFLRQRLDVAADTREEEPADALPVQLDGLAEWAVGDRCLAARLAGVPAADVARAEGARGALPPGLLGTAVLRRVGGSVEQLVSAAAPWTAAAARTAEVDVEVGGTRLSGVVRGVRPAGGGPAAAAVTVTYSRLKAKQELRAWVELLALTLAEPGAPRAAVVVGRGERGSTAVVRLGPVPGEQARRAMEDLLALRRTGLSLPLPLPVATGGAWASAAARGASAQACADAAAREWESGWDWPREDAEEEHRLLWGGTVPVGDLLAWAPPPGAPPGTPATFAELARRVWQPLLAARHRETA
ncbi:exodeoxyribonuclease V subunit gamma [Kineococcus auxinigenes]|uniref:exodeoxyribonuclease V subunit gamma n=1 Tax=Kineococcus sp. SYSU DK032 TaxID=3383153 RepID=UPI003D7DB567